MTVKDLMDKIQKELDKLDLSKIKTHEEFHSLMKETIVPLLPEKGFLFTTWDIEFLGNQRSNLCRGGDDDIVFRYDRTFIKYKTCKYTDRGTFSEPRLKIEDINIAELDIKNLDTYFFERQKTKMLKNCKEAIVEQRKELAQAEKWLEEAMDSKYHVGWQND